MSEKVQFGTNQPVEVALKYATGRVMEGEYGDSYMYSLTDGRVMFVQPIVNDRIQKLNPKAGEPLEICKAEVKRGNRRAIEWQVKRVDPTSEIEDSDLEKDLKASIAQAEARKVLPPTGGSTAAVSSQSYRANATHSHQHNGHLPETPLGASPAVTAVPILAGTGPTLLKLSLRAAVDAAIDAENYARERNRGLQFSSEDLRAIALSLYIQGARENGGSSWRN